MSIHQQRESKFMLVVHEESLLLRLRRYGNHGSSRSRNLSHAARHSLHLPHAKRTPPSANEAEDQSTPRQKIGGRNRLAAVVWEFEQRSLRADLESMGRESLSFEASYGSRVDSLNTGWNVLRDQLFALGKNFAQRSNISGSMGFDERSPFHLDMLYGNQSKTPRETLRLAAHVEHP